jgi:phosphohistidine phosphatase
MLLLIMRHGEAEAKTGKDAERRLTRLGVKESSNVLSLAKQMGTKVNAIASSPLMRARETAEIACRVFGLEYSVKNSLEPEGSPREVYEDLRTHNAIDTVLLISHQPLVSRLLADMLGAEPAISFSTSSLALVKVEKLELGGGSLIFMIPPRIPDTRA